ncbi:MAG TPA: mercury transporter MerT [Sphingomonadales bacterium]|nr:mercury transporter MerT [Sphingomonadales bacterium]
MDDIKSKKMNWIVGGAIITAIATISCCIIPLFLFTVGISGAWISNLTVLSPYQPIFIGVSLGLIGYGLYLLQTKRKEDCAKEACEKPIQGRRAYLLFLFSLILIVMAVAFPWFVRSFLE